MNHMSEETKGVVFLSIVGFIFAAALLLMPDTLELLNKLIGG